MTWLQMLGASMIVLTIAPLLGGGLRARS